jgi:hypothetical protein
MWAYQLFERVTMRVSSTKSWRAPFSDLGKGATTVPAEVADAKIQFVTPSGPFVAKTI